MLISSRPVLDGVVLVVVNMTFKVCLPMADERADLRVGLLRLPENCPGQWKLPSVCSTEGDSAGTTSSSSKAIEGNKGGVLSQLLKTASVRLSTGAATARRAEGLLAGD